MMLRSFFTLLSIQPQPYRAPPPPPSSITNNPKQTNETIEEYEKRILPSVLTNSSSLSKSQSQSSTNQTSSQSQSSSSANILDDECPWCVSMKSGPCGREFRIWQQCIKDVRAENESRSQSSLSFLSLSDSQRSSIEEKQYARVCFDHFRRLHSCIHANPRHKAYYKQFIALKDDEDDEDDIDSDDDDFDAADMPNDDDDE